MTKQITLAMLSLCLLLGACDDEKVMPLKSPCAGTEGSPCGPKRAVNSKSLVQMQFVPVSQAA